MVRHTEIIRQIDIHLNILLNTRAMFPYMKGNMIGVKECFTPPFYRNRGFNITFSFAEPLTAGKIDEINEIGHWVNQNFVIRLWALLESHKIVSGEIRINKQLDGHKEIEILRLLRNTFAHSSGRYDPRNQRHRELYKKIVEYFSLEARNHPEEDGKFPIPINRVLVPLTEGCKRYIQALAQV